MPTIRRREFIGAMAGGAAALAMDGQSQLAAVPVPNGLLLPEVNPEEGLFAYLQHTHGSFNASLYKRILGSANPFKEGDAIVGVAAADQASRANARHLLAQTSLRDLDAHPLLVDDLYKLLQQSIDQAVAQKMSHRTLGQLKEFLLTQDEDSIHAIKGGLSSQVIGCVVKLMSNQELITVGAKIFNPLPGSQIGAKGYLGARIQPNSPTDHSEDIRWQVFDSWSYAVGDVLIGTNPVSSEPESVFVIEQTLQDLLTTFGLEKTMPHCVLAHIDVQAEVERTWPHSTKLWFQSIAGSDEANATFDLGVDQMKEYAASRTGQYGLYFETGQGADFTNGHGHGFDMVCHESRKYGFARALTQQVASALQHAGNQFKPWVHLNDVAGFIGPEVFRTREQLVRCCLEDIVMGKLHGLCLGLDVCSTLHMDISLDDLDWCLDQIMPANPAYLMGLPTKIDPMLGYLTTGVQDHVRIREKFGYRVNDRMWQFYQQLGVIDGRGQPTQHFGDPLWVFLQYRRKQDDSRREEVILAEGKEQLAAVRGRGVFIAQGQGTSAGALHPKLEKDIRRIYADAKQSIWTELEPDFIAQIPQSLQLSTQSENRTEYILHPESGERLSIESIQALRQLSQAHAGRYNVQIAVSDGLNANSIMDAGNLEPYLKRVRMELVQAGYRTAPEHLVLTLGRVRAGYRIGEALFTNLQGPRIMLHIIGERPGTGHHTFSIYVTVADGAIWKRAGKVDHDITKVISGVATTALAPEIGAQNTVRVLNSMAS